VKSRTVPRAVLPFVLVAAAGGLAWTAYALLTGLAASYGRGLVGPVAILGLAGLFGSVVTAIAVGLLAMAGLRKRLALPVGVVTVLAVVAAGTAGASDGESRHRQRELLAAMSCEHDVDRTTLALARAVGRVVPVDGRRANPSPDGCRVLVEVPLARTDDPVGLVDGTASATYWQVSGERSWTSEQGYAVRVSRVESDRDRHLVTLLGTGPRLVDLVPRVPSPETS
jgi:hypothetical protein